MSVLMFVLAQLRIIKYVEHLRENVLADERSDHRQAQLRSKISYRTDADIEFEDIANAKRHRTEQTLTNGWTVYPGEDPPIHPSLTITEVSVNRTVEWKSRN